MQFHKTCRFAAILALVAGMLIGYSVTSDAAYADVDGYSGSRWRTPTLCVQNQIRNSTIRQASYDAIVHIRNNTNVHIVNKGSSSCSSYANVVYFRDGYYSGAFTGRYLHNGHTWGQTKSGTWTYFNNSGAVLQFNTRYKNSAYNWRHIAAHEIGHALGLDHRDGYCLSVMATGCAWKDRMQTIDIRTVNTIYGW